MARRRTGPPAAAANEYITLGEVQALIAASPGGGGVDTETRALKPAALFRGVLSKRLLTSPLVIIGRGSSSMAGTGAGSEEERWFNKTIRAIQAYAPTAAAAPDVRTMNTSGALSSAISGQGVFGVNAGIPGSRSGAQNGATPYVNANTLSAQVGLSPRAFLDMIGANDYGNGVTAATFKANIIARVDEALSGMNGRTFAHGFIHSYPRFDSAALGARVSQWVDFLTALLEVQALYPHVFVINTVDEWTRMGVGGEAGSDSTLDYIGSDEIHMNTYGHDAMANIVVPKLLGGVLLRSGSTVTPPSGTAPIISTTDLGALTVGTLYSKTIGYSGSTATAVNVTAGAMPAGVTPSLNTSTGVVTLSGTPTTAATYDVTLEIVNPYGSATQRYQGTVQPAGSVTPLTVLFSDSFDRANSNTVGTSATDKALGGGDASWQENAAAWQIIDNNLAATANTGGQFLAMGTADYEARGQIAVMPTASGTVLYTIDGRRSTVTSSGATQYRLYLRTDGSAYLANGTTSIGSCPAGTFTVGDWAGLRMKGTAISIVKASSATDPGTAVTTLTNTGVSNATGFTGFSRINSDTTGRWAAFAVVGVQ